MNSTQVRVNELAHSTALEMVRAESSRVLIIYTGGTIGMKNSDQGYVPYPNFLPQQVAKMSMFHDQDIKDQFNNVNIVSPNGEFCQNGINFNKSTLPSLQSPRSLFGKRIRYSILEYYELLDSSNMTMVEWVKIAQDIEINYQLFDAFVVLHGTDTMSYTGILI